MRIWRDIPDRPFIETRLRQIRATDKERVAGPRVKEILNMVDNYHRIKKDRLDYLGIREVLLLGIVTKIAAAVKETRTQPMFSNLMNKGTTIDALLDALRHRAAAKAEYLSILVSYYLNNPEAADPKLLMTQLDAPRNTDGHLPLVAGVRLEKMDPLHRDFEDGNPTDLGQLVTRWREEVENAGPDDKPPSLFVYLEATEHCLDESVAKLARTVRYAGADLNQETTYLLRFPGFGTVELGKINGGHIQWSPFDTTFVTKAVSAKGGYATALAYNWTIGSEIYAVVHNPLGRQEFRIGVHHSSITGGQEVRCAGMIGGVGGKITWLDDDSGHYKPPLAHLQRFVLFLNSKGAFAPKAQIEWHGGKAEVEKFIADYRRQTSPWQAGATNNQAPRRGITIGRNR